MAPRRSTIGLISGALERLPRHTGSQHAEEVPVKSKSVAAVIVAVGLAISNMASAEPKTQCDQATVESLSTTRHLVQSLRADKPGQMRVFSADGLEFTASEASWLKSQVTLIERECQEGRAAEATQRLSEVRQLIAQHR